MVYLPILLYGSENYTVSKGCESRFASAEMRYFIKQEETELVIVKSEEC
jgi:hypothetical protein